MYLVPAGISLHQEDGTTPRLITASIPDVSPDQRAGEEGEKIHLINLQRTQPPCVNPELTYQPSGNAYTRFSGGI